MLPSATDTANQPSLATPTQQVKVNGMKVVWDLFRAKGVSEKALTVIPNPGGDPLKNNIRSIFRSGTVFAVKGVSIPAQFLP